MGKDKSKGGVPNKHLHARVAFLHRAAEDLAGINQNNITKVDPTQPDDQPRQTETEGTHKASLSTAQSQDSNVLSVHLNTHLFQVARKAQIRLTSDIKHSVCKRCGSSLSALGSYRKYTENLSKGGKKPHADVLVLECAACGAVRRFPVGATRQKRKTQRGPPEAIDEKQLGQGKTPTPTEGSTDKPPG